MRDSLAIVAALALRDGPVCYIDGQPEDPEDPFEIEHVVPRSAGGGGELNDLSNLRLAHRSCNRTKGTNNVVIDETTRQRGSAAPVSKSESE